MPQSEIEIVKIGFYLDVKKDRKWYFTGSYGSHNGDLHGGNASGKMLSWENLL